MKKNIGYRLGRFTRHIMNRLTQQENIMRQKGVPSFLVKIPRYAVLATVTGLLLIGAYYLFLVVAILALGVLFVSTEYRIGYYSGGPKGPDHYTSGRHFFEDDDDPLF